MKYYCFIFEEYERGGRGIELAVDLRFGEGELSYPNLQGGSTKRSIRFRKEQLAHMRQLMNKAEPEKHIGGRGLIKEKEDFRVGGSWRFSFLLEDRKMYHFGDEDDSLVAIPASIKELIQYAVTLLALEDFYSYTGRFS